MSGVNRTRGPIVTALARRRGHHHVEILQSNQGWRHSTVDVGDFFNMGSYDLRRYLMVGSSDFGDFSMAAASYRFIDLSTYDTATTYDVYYQSGDMTRLAGTSYGYQYYSSEAGSSTILFYYRFYLDKGGPSGTVVLHLLSEHLLPTELVELLMSMTMMMRTMIMRSLGRDATECQLMTYEWMLQGRTPGGPDNLSLLTGFARHVTYGIWNGKISVKFFFSFE